MKILWPEKMDEDELRRLREESEIGEETFRQQYMQDWPIEYPDPQCSRCHGQGVIVSYGWRDDQRPIERSCKCLRPKP